MTEPFQPAFLKVLPGDITRVGFDGACILAVIRLVTALDDEKFGRVRIRGEMWWQASHSEIGALVGQPKHDTIRRIVARLTNTGALESLLVGQNGRARVMAYRVPREQQLRESASALTSDDADLRPVPPGANAEVRSSERGSASVANADPRNTPLYKNETEQVRKNGGRASAREVAVPDRRPPQNSLDAILLSPNPPPSFCARHPGGTDKPCRACGFAVRLVEDWYQFNKSTGIDQKLMGHLGRPYTEEDSRRIFGTKPVIEGDAS